MASLQTSTKILLKIIEFDRGASLPYRYLETSPQLFPQQLHSRHPLSPPVPTHDCRASPFTQNERHSSPNRTNPYPVVIGNSDREKDLRAKKKKKNQPFYFRPSEQQIRSFHPRRITRFIYKFRTSGAF